MNFNKDSAWYRLAQYGYFFNDHKMAQRNNLCPFMRRVFLGLFLTLCIYAPVVAFFVVCMLVFPVQGITAIWLGDMSYWWVIGAKDSMLHPLFSIGALLWLIVLVVFILYLITSTEDKLNLHTKISKWWNTTKQGTVYAAESIGLSPIIEYIRAIHNKICPKITFNKNSS